MSEGELDIVCGDGANTLIPMSAAPLCNDGGTIVGAVGVFQDTSRSKQTANELQRINDELELRVSARTTDLEQSRKELDERNRELTIAYELLQSEAIDKIKSIEALREKEQLLIQQNRLASLGEMINNIAHQWRQPLNTLGVIIQQMQLYYDKGVFTKEYLEKVIHKSMGQINHMSQTIEDFRTFFKPDKEASEFVIRDVVGRTVALLADNFKSLRINVEIDSSDNPVITGLPNEFSQVLLNILMNARDAFIEKHLENPLVRITIAVERGKNVVTISDNAGGIPPQVMDRIFEPYFTTKGPDKGTGIGLFMSKSIIEKSMNGQLTVRNTGEGAEFRIEVQVA